MGYSKEHFALISPMELMEFHKVLVLHKVEAPSITASEKNVFLQFLGMM